MVRSMNVGEPVAGCRKVGVSSLKRQVLLDCSANIILLYIFVNKDNFRVIAQKNMIE